MVWSFTDIRNLMVLFKLPNPIFHKVNPSLLTHVLLHMSHKQSTPELTMAGAPVLLWGIPKVLERRAKRRRGSLWQYGKVGDAPPWELFTLYS